MNTANKVFYGSGLGRHLHPPEVQAHHLRVVGILPTVESAEDLCLGVDEQPPAHDS